jgi:hypothetical protein
MAKSSDKDLLKNVQLLYKTDKTQDVIKLISGLSNEDEFEISINRKTGLTVLQYIELATYLIADREKTNYELNKEVSLDVSYNYDNSGNSYRITIVGEDRVNRLISSVSERRNHTIFSIFTSNITNQTKDESKNVFIIEKIKDKLGIIDIDQFDLRVRLSQEKSLLNDKLEGLKKLSETERNKIMFRYKQRLSYIVPVNKNISIRIDLTNVKQNIRINNLEDSPVTYELELELLKLTDKKLSPDDVELAYSHLMLCVYRIHQILQKSHDIITLSSQDKVLTKLKTLLYGNPNDNKKDLPAMQSQSLENQHVASELTTQYVVDDKADGERYFMFITEGKIYLISNNLEIKEVENNNYNLESYNDTIIDGEHVFIPEKNKFVFLGFDILVHCGKDIRDEVKLEDRLEKLNDVLKNCFRVKTVTKKYDGSGNLNEILAHYKNQIKMMFDEMNKKLMTETNVVMGKLFFMPLGLYPAEIYAYAEMVWTLYTSDEQIKCPYTLDGLMFTPLLQKYTRNAKEIRYQIYKWKPTSHNSIDFYVRYEKNAETLQLLNVYDNSMGNSLEETYENRNIDKENDVLDNVADYKVGNKIYRIVNLYVGSTKTGIEQPVLFGRENNLFLAYMYLQDGEVRDKEGNIIQDETVVEFAYNNDPTIEHPYRWVPLRTRFDKTDSVVKYQRKYGNNEMIANKVWRSIISPFDFNDIKMLANEETHDNYMKNVVRSRVTKEDIVKERSENIYYQIQTNLSKAQRYFHNFVKTNLVQNTCTKKLLANDKIKQLKILDTGIGRGGDLMRFYNARVNSLVGIDIVYDNIYSATDGAVSRFQTFKRKFPNFPKCTFVVADAGVKFNLDSQEKVLGVISDQNKQAIKQIFGKDASDNKHEKFDVFNCQMQIHYFFENDAKLQGLCENISRYLDKYGYMIITTNDAKVQHKMFGSNDTITQYYTENGKKKILFEYKKLYSDNDLKKTGLAVDFHNASFMMEGTYWREYLVDPDYLIEQFEKNCGLKLVDTDTFENQFYVAKHFFDNVAPFEADERTKKQFMQIAEYYNMDDEMNKSGFEMTRMLRYYVFQKM